MRKLKKKVMVTVFCMGAAAVMSACSGTSGADKGKSAATEAVQEESQQDEELKDELLAEYARDKYVNECESVDYRDLIRYEDSYKDKKLYFQATVKQTSGDTCVCVSDDGSEYYLHDKRTMDATKLLNDDRIWVYGDYVGAMKTAGVWESSNEEMAEINARYIEFDDSEPEETTEAETEPETTAAPDYQTMYVVNCKQSITLRTSPSTQAAEIRQIPLGAAVSFIENAENGFCKVVYLGNTGYALSSYLSYSAPQYSAPPAPAPAPTPAANQEANHKNMRVEHCNESITLRTSPSTKAAEIRQIPLGSYLEFID